MRIRIKKLVPISILGVVAACAQTPPPAPLPAIVYTPPVVVRPPAMPLPPAGASVTMNIPPVGYDGVRITPNRGLTEEEHVWHFRSALNVAALTCQGPVWGQIASDYNEMLKTHKRRFAQTDKAIDADYKRQYPKENALRLRDTKLTDLYNYFALPPVKAEYCDTVLQKISQVQAINSNDLPKYSVEALQEIDAVFIRFFDAYEAYERALADWNQKYGQTAISADTYGPVASTSVQSGG